MPFPRLDPELTADALEQTVLRDWKTERLFHRVTDARRNDPAFVFYEGPPTANGRPGIHHVFARTIKDLVCRYRTMLGHSVTRIAGWDTHGLPVEIEVEKQLKISGKREIEAFGIEKFNRLCRESVFTYKADWEQLSDRIGYWLDYEHPYITYDPKYIESVWWLLRSLHDKGLLYRGHKVLPYCPRCGTALSSHELAQGYDQVQTNSVYVAFPLASDSKRQLVIWTTTPWTLLSNVAVAVHADLEYGEWELDGTRYIAAAALAGSVRVRGRPLVEGKRVGTVRGKDLIGQRYVRPLDVVPLPPDGERAVVAGADFVSADEGTGLVHLAPAFGADDYAVGRRDGLAFVNPVAPDGTFQGTTWPEINGRLVTDKETNHLIIERLKREGRWLDTRPHEHQYPFCWRCDSALIYYARTSWFVRTTAFKDRLVQLNGAIDWHPPEVGTGRFGEWLANNVDWALSRERYWGTPLNVWECDREAEHREVIGSYAELAERPLPKKLADVVRRGALDPHKPYIDEYTWPCRACKGTMRRVPEVIDAWFDSGAMPFAQWHYPFEHEREFKAHVPADFICEGVDQTRGWFYSLLAIAAGVVEAAPYKHVIVNELVLDAQGQKMSKSRGNVVDPWEVIGRHGADAVRLYLLGQSAVWLPKRFDPAQVGQFAGGFLNTLRHTYDFLAMFAFDWRPDDRSGTPRGDLMDRWLGARLDQTTRTVREAWNGYDVTTGVRAVVDFVDDLSNWYVRLSKPRFWAPDRAADPAALAALDEALVTVSRLLAPAAPFVSDWLHRALVGTSVHLATFPADRGRGEAELLLAMDAVRRLASLARAARATANLPVRQPVARLKVAVPRTVRGPLFEELLGILGAEVNVKKCDVVESDDELVSLRGKANFRALGKRYAKDTPRAAEAVSQLTAAELRKLENGGSVRVGEFEFHPEDVTVTRAVATDWLVQADGPFVVALDPALTDDLRREGLAREVVNRVQRLRKEAAYEYTTRIELSVSGAADVVAAATAFRGFIEGETLARQTLLGAALETADIRRDVDIEGRAVTIALRRHDGRKGGP